MFKKTRKYRLVMVNNFYYVTEKIKQIDVDNNTILFVDKFGNDVFKTGDEIRSWSECRKERTVKSSVKPEPDSFNELTAETFISYDQLLNKELDAVFVDFPESYDRQKDETARYFEFSIIIKKPFKLGDRSLNPEDKCKIHLSKTGFPYALLNCKNRAIAPGYNQKAIRIVLERTSKNRIVIRKMENAN